MPSLSSFPCTPHPRTKILPESLRGIRKLACPVSSHTPPRSTEHKKNHQIRRLPQVMKWVAASSAVTSTEHPPGHLAGRLGQSKVRC